ncbi:MAG: alpha/beta hydrolase [Bryobacteraceae bacterium]|nr:alpha/beta hydrolase [Bryobacteraceae bacterium]
MHTNDFHHHRAVNGAVGLHAVSLGNGPAVVLLHGFPQHWWMWRQTMLRLAEAGYRAIAIDQRGCGGSDIPHGPYDKATLAGDVAAIMDALSVPAASIVGYDHGGGTALALAYTAPHRVEKLVTIEYAPPGFGYEMGLTAAPGNVNWQLAFFTHPDVAVHFIAGKERELLAWYFWHWAYNPDAVDQADFEVYVRQLQKPGALRGGMMHFASVFEDMAMFKHWAAAGPLTVPTLGIGGEIAAGVYGEIALKALAGDVRGAVIAGAGHWIAEEQPAALSACLIDFLQGA